MAMFDRRYKKAKLTKSGSGIVGGAIAIGVFWLIGSKSATEKVSPAAPASATVQQVATIEPENECARSASCTTRGECSRRGRRGCEPRTDADCAQGSEPRLEGRIHALPAIKECVRPMSEAASKATSDECRGEIDCWHEGLCGLKSGKCAPTDVGHCIASRACARWGRCSLRKGTCVAISRQDCDQGSRTKGLMPKAGACVSDEYEPPPSTAPGAP